MERVISRIPETQKKQCKTYLKPILEYTLQTQYIVYVGRRMRHILWFALQPPTAKAVGLSVDALGGSRQEADKTEYDGALPSV